MKYSRHFFIKIEKTPHSVKTQHRNQVNAVSLFFFATVAGMSKGSSSSEFRREETNYINHDKKE